MDWLALGLGFLTGAVLGSVGIIYLLYRTGLVTNAVLSIFDQIFASLPEKLSADPEFASKLVKPFISASMKELGAEKSPGARNLNIGGWKIPMELVQALLPNLMKKTAPQLAEELANPFR